MGNSTPQSASDKKPLGIRQCHRQALWIVAILLSVCSACSDQKALLPTSGGKPYEVLVIGTDTAAVSVAKEAFASLTETSLPQPEPSFDVSAVCGSLDETLKYTRSIILVTVDSTRFTRTSIRYRKNVYAKPQMVIYLNTPSANSLKAFLGGKELNTIAMLIDRSELNRQIHTLQNHHAPKASELAKKLFNYDLWVPEDMQSSKTDKDFLWLSNNANSGMQNICLFYSDNMDSVLAVNIKGETDNMHLRTVAGSITRSHSDGREIVRGLWEMEGDAMGGPFVAHCQTDSATGKIFTAFAFVYAPEMNKRNKMKQLEAALYTVKKNPARAAKQ